MYLVVLYIMNVLIYNKKSLYISWLNTLVSTKEQYESISLHPPPVRQRRTQIQRPVSGSYLAGGRVDRRSRGCSS